MTVYNTYGTVFGIALLVVVVSLAVVVRESTVDGSGVRRAWSVAVGGLAAAAVGAVLEYGFEILPGFVLELVGFPILIVGMVMVGVSLRREGEAGLGKSVLVGLSGLAAVIVGGAFVGHMPSGPALIPVAACVLIGFSGLPFASLTTLAV